MSKNVTGPSTRCCLLTGILLLVLLVSGCSHYQLGHPGQTDFRSIHVAIVDNHAFVPQVKSVLTRDIRNAFMTDGTLKLAGKTEADVVLTVTVIDYSRKMSAAQSEVEGATNPADLVYDDPGLGQAFEIRLAVVAVLRDAQSGEVMMPARTLEVFSSAVAVPDGDELFLNGTRGLVDEEYHLLPVLSRDMSRKIKDAVVSTW